MSTWNLTLRATLDSAPGDDEAIRLGKRIAGKRIAIVSTNEERFRVTAVVDADNPMEALGEFVDTFGRVVPEAGYGLVRWDGLEALSPAESEQRLDRTDTPPTVSAATLAKMCGVSRQRIYELEAQRRKASDAGQSHPFPAPVAPGWWSYGPARYYAATRKRRPGPEKQGK